METKTDNRERTSPSVLVEELFLDCRKGTFLQYLFLLLRVGPIDSYDEDPFYALFKKILVGSEKINLDEEESFWSFLANLIFVSRDGNYNPFIFKPNTRDFRESLGQLLQSFSGKYSDIIDLYFPARWEDSTPDQKKLSMEFVRAVFINYRRGLRLLTEYPKFIKLKTFDVVELITNHKKRIVDSFKVHFSNGTHAIFKRTEKHVDTINFDLGPGGVGVFVGNISELKQEWMVGDKRLYEIGLPGKYNKPGEWKPLVFPGDSDPLFKEAGVLSKGDHRLTGVLFYIFCTGHRVIEFAAKSRLSLPRELVSFKTGLHLYQVKNENPQEQEEIIWDGWIELETIEVEEVLHALDIIEKTFSALSFTFDVPIEWALKYNVVNQTSGISSPNEKELMYINKVLGGLKTDTNHYVLSSIDWFERGISSKNPFNQYICYYLAIETLAIKISSGETEKSIAFGMSKKPKDDVAFKKCVTELHKQYFDTKPKAFVDKAYNDCLKTITQNLKTAIVAVFGKDSNEYKEFFEKTPTIPDVRNKLIHEPYSRWSLDEQLALNEKVLLVKRIAKDFILRICFELKPGEKLKKLTQHMRLSLYTDNPNSALVASDLKIFPTTDWKIKHSWINPRVT